MSAQNTLVGFAVLRANYNAQTASYIDNFHPFALDVLKAAHPRGLDVATASRSIRKQFGLTIPDLVVERILKRLCKKGLAARDAQIFTATDTGLKKAPDIAADIDRYNRQHKNLVEMYKKFVEDQHPGHLEVLDADPSQQLANYLEFHSIPLLARSLSRTHVNKYELKPGSEYVISKFISHLAETDQAGFSYVEDTVKGAILASVVTLDTSGFSQSLKSLTIYFDTPSLVKLLGFEGESSRAASTQLVELAVSQGANVSCFQHSVQELDGVLIGAEQFIRSSGKRVQMRPIDANFQDAGATAADVALLRNQLTDLIESAGIEVRPKPGDYVNYGLDETALEDALKAALQYRSDATRRFDVDSLSAIHRLRKGGIQQQLERCGAVLVTANHAVVRGTQSFNGEEKGWPLAMTEGTLAAILWARSPSIGSGLPRQQILATAHAAMQPDPYLWGKYIEEVEKLEARGQVGRDEAIILRSTSVARSALMEMTLGVNEEVSADSALGVLDHIQSTIEAPLLKQIVEAEQSASQMNAAAEESARSWMENEQKVSELSDELRNKSIESTQSRDEIERLKSEHQATDIAIARSSAQTSSRIITTSMFALAVPLAILAGLKLWNPPWLEQAPSGVATACLVAAISLGVLGAIRTFKPGTVQDWAKPIGNAIARRIERRRRAAAGRDQSLSFLDSIEA